MKTSPHPLTPLDLLGCDRQISDPDTASVIDGIRNGWGGGNIGIFRHPRSPERPFRPGYVEGDHFQIGRILGSAEPLYLAKLSVFVYTYSSIRAYPRPIAMPPWS